jgi:hypothetical protein
MRRATVFIPASVVGHPMLFRSSLGRQRNIVEYQVRQTAHGADVDLDLLRQTLTRELQAIGVPAPEVAIGPVPTFERQSTGRTQTTSPLIWQLSRSPTTDPAPLSDMGCRAKN